MSLTEYSIQRALARSLGWHRHTIVPNLCFYHEMDVAVLTRAGCLYEYEIKCAQRDWTTDNRKDVPQPIPDWLMGENGARVYPNPVELQKAQDSYARPIRNRKHVKRFYYAYAQGLVCPEWVPEWAGLIEASLDGKRKIVTLREVRAATDRAVEKPPESLRVAMLTSIYHRYWQYAMPHNEVEPVVEPVSVEAGP